MGRESNMKNFINLSVHGVITNRVGLARQRINSIDLTVPNTAAFSPLSIINVSSPNKCRGDYDNQGCMIS
jgi:hypothetical protein